MRSSRRIPTRDRPSTNEGDGQPFLTTEMPGAVNQPHHKYPDASHFLQADQGVDIAKRVNEFIAANPI
jgi:pimeloyl-ACP methyl ester carboxylesterase